MDRRLKNQDIDIHRATALEVIQAADGCPIFIVKALTVISFTNHIFGRGEERDCQGCQERLKGIMRKRKRGSSGRCR